jgi:deazaflavin-dependent oxidoreductase (nitroreductase family)
MFKVLLTAAAIVVAAALVYAGFFREAGRRRLLPFLRPLLKVINPRVLRAAARGETPYGIVHHTGRRSGAAYDTPVEAHRTPGGALILLPYGPVTDWCRNVLAAGGCTLTLDGKELPLRAPEVVPAGVAEAQVPETVARRWRRQGIAHYLSLQSYPRVPCEEP